MAREQGAEKQALVRRVVSASGVPRVIATVGDSDAPLTRRALAAGGLGVGIGAVGLGATDLTAEVINHGARLFETAGSVAATGLADAWGAGAFPISFGAAAAVLIGGESAISKRGRQYVDTEGFYPTDAQRAENVGIPHRNAMRHVAVWGIGIASAAGLVAAGLDQGVILGHAEPGVGRAFIDAAEAVGSVGAVGAISAMRWNRRVQRQLAAAPAPGE